MKWFALILMLLASLAGAAEHEVDPKEKAPAEITDPVQIIDYWLSTRWQQRGLKPSEKSTDHEFARRAYLDIIGRIPTKEEAEAFAAKPDRKALCSALVTNEEYPKHWGRNWANWLMMVEGEDEQNTDAIASLARYLSSEIAKPDHRWDETAKSLITGSKDRATRVFRDSHRGNNGTFEPLTERTSRVLMGIRVECAKCHNHKFDERFQQSHYWGMNAFMRQPSNLANGLQAVPYKRPDEVELNQGPTFLNGLRLNEKGLIVDASGKAIDNIPRDAEAAFAHLLTGNEYFQRAFVNRVWGNLFGLGLNTSDVDDFGAADKVNFPGLLRDLSRKFKEKSYNPRELLRWICESQAYSLSSRGRTKNEAENEFHFSAGPVKPMTPDQLASSLVTVFGEKPDDNTKSDIFETTSAAGRPFTGGGVTMGRQDAWLDTLTRAGYTADAGKPNKFKGTIAHGLAMMNSERIMKAVAASPLIKLEAPVEAKISAFFLTAVGRPATPDEVSKLSTRLLNGRTGNERWEDLLWALVNSNEFLLNH